MKHPSLTQLGSDKNGTHLFMEPETLKMLKQILFVLPIFAYIAKHLPTFQESVSLT